MHYFCGKLLRTDIMEHLIVIADENERQLLAKYLPDCTWPVLVTGIGCVNVIHALRDMPRDTQILNVGYAGSADYAIGTLVEVSRVSLNHPNCDYDEPECPLTPLDESELQTSMFPLADLKSVCYTGTDFVLASNYRECVFDMELGFIAALGFERVSALKLVSDNLSLHTYHDTVRQDNNTKNVELSCRDNTNDVLLRREQNRTNQNT